jgi:hypothetical protein
MRNAFFASVVVAIGVLAVATAAVSAVGPPQGTQSDNAFAGSYAAKGVTSTVPTEQQTSCYAPELTYFGALSALQGYPDGGMSACDGAATTGENLGPYPTQDVAKSPCGSRTTPSRTSGSTRAIRCT